ncbi:uncharacterized protein [Apostichopus japonicus]|uniref:uncharacterized protein isoform X2 n=1 Tax=Stichopus japonicus TaxID=307972 RepID=UPI003AB6053A
MKYQINFSSSFLYLFFLGGKLLMAEGCNVTLSNSTGTFTSPEYPNVYPSNLDCTWRLQAAEGKVIELTFDDVQLEADTDGQCYDSITIADPTPGSEFLPATFCNDGPGWPSHPIRFLSTTNQLTIHMKTNNIYAASGFSARYSQVQPRTEYIFAIETDIASFIRFDRFSKKGSPLIPLPGSTFPFALTFDPISAYFYYTDIQEKFIARINIKGDIHDILVDDHIGTPSGIAVAYITGLMYWADSSRNEVSVSRLDGTSRKYISPPDSGCETPRAVALSLDHRSVFWNCRQSIQRSNADGSRLVALVDGLNDVKTLQIDPYDNVLYWINALGDTADLERINLNGTDRQTVYSDPLFADFHGFTMDRFTLFWSHAIDAALYYIARGGNTFNSISIGVEDPLALEGLYYYRSDQEISAQHQCAIDNGQCSELCFPEGVSFVCVGVKPSILSCPSDVQMYTQGPQQISWQEPTALSRIYGVQTQVALPFRNRTHIPGSTFNMGHTTVVYIFEDDVGNEAKCSFNIDLSPITTTNEACDVTLSNSTGTFTSPEYPYLYPLNLNCTWHLQAAEGKVIELTFDDVQLEADTDGQCYDSITIADPTPGSEFLPAIFCNDGPGWPSHPIRFLSTTNQLTIHMQTNNISAASGFSARYSQVQPRTEYIFAVETDIASLIRFDRFSKKGSPLIPLPGSTFPFALTFDPISAYFYYTDIHEKLIARINIKGDIHDILVDDHIGTPSGIAVAYITGLMYWADTSRNEVSVSRLDGTSRKYISPPDSGCETPRAVVLSLDHRSVFWNCRQSIKRSKADGSELVVLVDGLNDVKTLQIDPYDNVLYWINALRNTADLERINLNGTDRQTVYSHPLFAAFHGFTMDRFALFWSHAIDAALYYIERDGNTFKSISIGVEDPLALEGLYYYMSDQEISAQHQCAIDNGECSELCFPEGVSFVCVGVKPSILNCPNDVQMYTQGPQQIPWQEPTAVSRIYGVQTQVALPFRSRTHFPGSTFNLGHTTVVYIFEDDVGNEAKCSFNIDLSPITTTNEACDVTLSNSTGTFTSPEYPNLYPSNLNCTWHLQAAEGKVIELTFDDVQLQADIGGQCLDTITIADPMPGSDFHPATFCGDGPGWPRYPIRFHSTTNQLTIHMKTDVTDEATGFSARYSQVNPRTEYIAAVGTDIASIIRFDRFSTTRLPHLPLPRSTRPSALTFDPISAYLYYTDIQEKIIARINIEGDTRDILVDDHIGTPSGIAVAYITGLMYWADTSRNEVSVSRLDGTSRKYISPPDSGCETPRAVTLSLDHRSVFWNCRQSLKRSKADGSELVVLVDGLNDVKTLQIDPYDNVLYWINALRDTADLESINLNGSDRQTVYSHPVFAAFHGFAIDRFAFFWSHPIEARLYYTARGGNTLYALRLAESTALEGLFYYKSDQEISAQHQCAIDNGQCSELCFPEGVSFACVGVKPLVSHCPGDVHMFTQGPTKVPWQEPTAVSRIYGVQTPVALPFRSRTHIPGSTFNLGLTTVVYIFTDDLGNEAKCSFNITLSTITTTNEACDVTRSSSTGTFTSPEYPNLYPSNLNCTWHLQAAEGKVIELMFDDVQLAADISGHCYDVITIADPTSGSDFHPSTFCDDGPGWPAYPIRFLSTTNQLTIHMQTDNTIEATGFSARYSQVKPRTEYIAAIGTDIASIVRFDRFSKKGIKKLRLPGSTHPFALTFDPISAYFYYTDVQVKFIARVNIKGDTHDILVDDYIDTPSGIAVAYITGLMYWADSSRNEVSVSRLDGTSRKYISPPDSGCETPRAVALSLDHRSVFWNCRQSLKRSKADGSELVVLVDGLNDVKTLQIDPYDNVLYWINALGDTADLERINLNGTDRQTVYSHPLFADFHGFTMDRFALFWSHAKNAALYYIARGGNTFNSISIGVEDPLALEGLYYYRSDQEISAQHQCAIDNGQCSELCFPEGVSFVCVGVKPSILSCPSDVQMYTQGPQQISWQEPTALSRIYGVQTQVALPFRNRTHIPGSTFNMGHTTVVYIFEDDVGNEAKCSFNIDLSPITTTNEGCDVTLSNSTGTFTSPEYPNLYPRNLNCTWHLQAAEGKVIELTFDDVQLEADTDGQCYDTITIADPTPGSEFKPATFCNDGPVWPSHPIRFLSTTNQLTIHMQTNNISAASGFSVRYSQVQPRTEYIFAVETDIASIIRFDRFSKKGAPLIPLPGSTFPFALTFDPISAYFYYTDIQEKLIARINIKGDIHDILIDDHIGTPSGIAVAYITGLMYWADSSRNEVSVSRLDGTSRKYISPPDSGCETPRAVALSLDHRSVFWNCRQSLKRSKADGSELVVLVDGLNEVKTLQIDPYDNVLYWINALGDTADLERINLNGTDRQTVYRHPLFAAFHGFTMDRFALFWSHAIDAALYYIARGGNTFNSISIGVEDPLALEGLYYYRSDQEISAQHQCAIDNGQCSELCFPEGVSFVCAGVKPSILNCPSDVHMYTQGPQQIPWQEPTALSRIYGVQTPVTLPFRNRTHIPGSTFNMGHTTVVYIFEDDVGNEAKCSFNIDLSPITTTNEVCDVTLSNSTGIFTSPEYPNLYPPNLNCTWHLQAAEGKVIELTFDAVQLEADTGGHCYDSITIADPTPGSEFKPAIFCDNGPRWPSHPIRFLSTTNQLTIHMQTDSTIGATGFSARYSQVKPRTEYIAAVRTDIASIVRFDRFSIKGIPNLPLPGSTHPFALTFDPISAYFYYTDIQEKFIARVNIKGDTHDILVDDHIDTPSGIAVAYITGLMYWADTSRNEVSVSRLDGTSRKYISPPDSGCETPRAVTLSLDHRSVFWNCRQSLKRSKADGSELVVLVDGLNDVKTLQIDPYDNVLYWINALGESADLERINLNGTDRQQMYSNPVFAAFHGFTMDRFALFWSIDASIHHVERGGSIFKINTVVDDPPALEGLFYYRSDEEISAQHQCAIDNGQCSELCFPEGVSFVCVGVKPTILNCPSDVQMYTQGPQQIPWQEPTAVSRIYGVQTQVALPFRNRTHIPGSTFNLGHTTVEYIFEDDVGNEAKCSFNIDLSPITTTNEGCDVTLSNSTGTFTSPEYPYLYPLNLNCTWRLQAAEGKVIELTFDDVQLEADTDGQCYDSITIADPTPGSEFLPAIFCNDGPGWPSHPIRFLSTTNQLTIHMQTNNISAASGFSARYSQVQPRTEYIFAVETDIASLIRFDRFSKKGSPLIPLPGSTFPFALTFDPISAYFYYTDIHEKLIARINIKGDIHDILVDDHIGTPSGIAVAYITGLMYWADTSRNEVSVSRLDGTSRKYISPPDSGCETPRAVVLSLDHRSVFWNCRQSIKRSNADGSELVVLVDGLNDVKTLQIDPYDNVLYWINALGNTADLERINLNGTDRQTVYSHPLFAAFHGFTMDRFALFWSHAIDAALYYIERDGNTFNSISIGVEDPLAMEGLYYYRSDQEISAQHQCAIDNGECSELCFPEGVSFVCVGVKPSILNCPNDVQMFTQGPQQIPWQEPTAVSRIYGVQTQVALPFRNRTHIPGSTFNLGHTTVVYIFEDDVGNEAKCSFNIDLSPVTTTNEACDVTLSNSTGTFTSPEYPNLYPSNLNCTWHLQAAEGKVIELTFDDVQLEADIGGQCYDTITISDPTPGSDFHPATFCGDGPGWPRYPIRFHSTTNQLTIHMKTDVTDEATGFSARYSQVNPRTEYIAAVGTDIASIIRFDRFSTTRLPHLPLPRSTRPSALTFDPISAYFYYTDIQEKIIARMNIEGDTRDILVDDHIGTPSGIAVAYITGLMYWADSSRNEVSVSRLDGTSRKYISPPDSGCETPRAVTLSLDHRSVFWNCRQSIKMSKADGSELVVLVDGLNDVKTLQIDPYDNVLYWINALRDTADLESINLNGSDRQTVYSHPLFAAFHGFTMDRFALFWSHPIEARLYYTARGGNTLYALRIASESPALEGLFYYKSDQEISAQHQCAIDNGQCSELCFPEGVSFVCVGVKPLVSHCPGDVHMYTQGPTKVPWQEPTAVSRIYGVRTPVALPFRSRTHIPGSIFNLGLTTVVYIFTDDLGNEAKCSFNITLSTITTTNEACDVTRSSSTGTFTSPEYPNLYPSNLNCTWHLQAAEGKVIELMFDDVQLEADISGHCYDVITIADPTPGSDFHPSTFCDDGPGWPAYPIRFLSTTNQLTIHMQTDNTIEAKGFSARYSQVKPRTEYIAAIGTDIASIVRFDRFSKKGIKKLRLPGSMHPFALTFDPISAYFYYTDVQVKFIARVNIKGDTHDILVDDHIDTPSGIAVAYITGLMYWADSSRNEVSVSRLDGTSRKYISPPDSGCETPRAVALSLDHRSVFWNCRQSLKRSKADGSELVVLVDGLNDVKTLQIDPYDNVLYWINALDGTADLERINLNGSDRQTVYSNPLFAAFHGFTMDRFALFWSIDASIHYVERGGNIIKIITVVDDPPALEGLFYYRSDEEISAQHQCAIDNGQCSELCFPEGFSFVCVGVKPLVSNCPDGVQMYTQGPTKVPWQEPTAVSRIYGVQTPVALPFRSRTHFPGSIFNLGHTTVVYIFEDDLGNEAKCSFTIELSPITTTNEAVRPPASTIRSTTTTTTPAWSIFGEYFPHIVGSLSVIAVFLIVLAVTIVACFFRYCRCSCKPKSSRSIPDQQMMLPVLSPTAPPLYDNLKNITTYNEDDDHIYATFT